MTILEELKQRIRNLNDDLAWCLASSPEFRNQERIEWLEGQIIDLERQIKDLQSGVRSV